MGGVSRRECLKLAALAAGATLTWPGQEVLAGEKGLKVMGPERYILPDLPYPYDALEPYIDKQTLMIHHDKHHAGYVRGLNGTLEKLKAAQAKGDVRHIRSLCRALAFHGSGHVLHTLYFSNLAPKGRAPRGTLLAAITSQFGSVDTLIEQLLAASETVSGSGWGVLAYEPLGGRLMVLQLEKHENQIVCGAAPLLVIDVWEHAYYLKYQNRRGEYLAALENVLDWEQAGKRFDRARYAH